jgi:hypothetical protein
MIILNAAVPLSVAFVPFFYIKDSPGKFELVDTLFLLINLLVLTTVIFWIFTLATLFKLVKKLDGTSFNKWALTAHVGTLLAFLFLNLLESF